MKKRALLPLVLLSTLSAGADPAENPLIEMFPREIRFYNSFEGGLNPDVGITTISPSYNRYHLARRGFLGKCLDVGIINYSQTAGKLLVDTEKPGTILIWVKLLREQHPISRDLAQWEGGASVFEVMGSNNSRMLIMKSVDTQWGSGQFWFFYEGDDEHGAHFSMHAAARCSFADWKVGEWRLIAASWTAEKMFISVNGQPYASAPYSHKMQALRGGCYLKTTEWKSAETQPGMFAVDECAILSRKLSDEEVALVYEEMMHRHRARRGFLFYLTENAHGGVIQSDLQQMLL